MYSNNLPRPQYMWAYLTLPSSRHSALSVASSSASSRVMSMSFKSRLMMSIQFFLGRPGFLLYPLSSHGVAWRGILESSILNTWFFFLKWWALISATRSSSWSLHFSLCLSTWFLAVFIGTCDELLPVSSSVWLVVAIIQRHTVMLRWQVTHTTWLLLADWCSYFSSLVVFQRHLMLCWFSSCTLCHSFLISIRCSPGSRRLQLIRLWRPRL